MICSNCKTEINDTDDVFQLSNGQIHQRCAILRKQCIICRESKYISKKDAMYFGHLVCYACRNRDTYFTQCIECKNTIPIAICQRTIRGGTQFVCPDCFAFGPDLSKPYSNCNNCGTVFKVEKLKRHQNGHVYCENCYPPEYDFRYDRLPAQDLPAKRRNDYLGGEYCGLELECYHFHKDGKPIVKQAPAWGWCRDGSISGFPEGSFPSEFVSPILHGNSALVSVADFLAALEPGTKANVNKSCGFHVHVQSKELSPIELRNVISLWLAIEEWAYTTVPPTRKTNRHSQPLNTKLPLNYVREIGDINGLKALLYGTLDQASINRYVRDKYNTARYYSLNVHSHFYRGTLEFRMHPGTLNWKKIRYWLELCTKVVDVGKEKPDWTVQEFMTKLDKQTVLHFQERIKHFSVNT